MTKYDIGYLAQRADPTSLAKVLSEAIREKKEFADGMEEAYKTFDPHLNAKRLIEAFEKRLL